MCGHKDRVTAAWEQKQLDLAKSPKKATGAELDVTLRRSRIVRTKMDIMRVAIADPGTIEVVAFGLREVEIIGKQTGSTSLTLWLGNEQQSRILSLLVTVNHDTGVEDRRRLVDQLLRHPRRRRVLNAALPPLPVAPPARHEDH